MEPGTRVEVRSRFNRAWARGFEIVDFVDETEAVGADGEAITGRAFRVRRRSDGQVLPALFVEADIREERRGRSMWWV